jgi:hypothetical protein
MEEDGTLTRLPGGALIFQVRQINAILNAGTKALDRAGFLS